MVEDLNNGLRFFKEDEFNKACPSCSLKDMDYWFMLHLDNARCDSHVPFVINSAYRSKDYEIAHGRAGTSAHTLGLAVDIRCCNNKERYEILKALFKHNFSRIGIHRNYIHVDDSFTHTDDVVWLYD